MILRLLVRYMGSFLLNYSTFWWEVPNVTIGNHIVERYGHWCFVFLKSNFFFILEMDRTHTDDANFHRKTWHNGWPKFILLSCIFYNLWKYFTYLSISLSYSLSGSSGWRSSQGLVCCGQRAPGGSRPIRGRVSLPGQTPGKGPQEVPGGGEEDPGVGDPEAGGGPEEEGGKREEEEEEQSQSK